jgi:hypothetical protein
MLQTTPARRGKAAFVAASQAIEVINIHGVPIVDSRAFRRVDLTEFDTAHRPIEAHFEILG